MTMLETEWDILADLEELSDTISQYTFLIECANQAPKYPEELRLEQFRIKECQVNTWVFAEISEGICRFFGDSESLIVRGAIALLQEIYDGRTEAEVHSYDCRLLQDERFLRHFTREQRKGLLSVAESMKKI